MAGKKGHKVVVVRRSCLTGKVVWIYRGPSRHAARSAYWRACQEEIRRVRSMPEAQARRRSNIMGLLDDCLSSVPFTESPDEGQESAARRLKEISMEDNDTDMEFYRHILEERRRRAELRAFRKKQE